MSRNRVISKVIYKVIPFIISILLISIIYSLFLSDSIKEQISYLLFNFSEYTNDDLMELVLYGLLYLSSLFVLAITFYGFYLLIKGLWTYICKVLNLVKAEKVEHILTLVSKYSEVNNTTTMLNVNNVITPIRSSYTTYYGTFKVGNLESKEIKKSISKSTFDSIKEGKEYRAKLVDEKVLGITVNYYLDLTNLKSI